MQLIKTFSSKKMKEWGVAIEKVRVMDESIFYDKSGGISTRRNGYGWKIFSFVLVLIMCACLMFPIVVLKDMGMLFISIPFGIVFLIVYKVIISRKSYCLKWTKRLYQKIPFLSKRYLWKDLRVKLVASEGKPLWKGVLFIKKNLEIVVLQVKLSAIRLCIHTVALWQTLRCLEKCMERRMRCMRLTKSCFWKK